MSPPTTLLSEARTLQTRLRRLGFRWECDNKECDGLPHEGWLHHHARGAQHEPDSYTTWALITGRGYGKTRTGAETVKKWSNTLVRPRIAIIAKNDREARRICFEGPAGLLSIIDPDSYRPDDYKKSSGSTELRLRNGTTFMAFSAERPDNLRGYSFDGAWFDEFATWPPDTAQEVVDNIAFCLREAKNPKTIVTTTPKAVEHVVKLIRDAEQNDSIVITRGSMLDNEANLSKAALRQLYDQYDGTRVGRQELYGELLLDVEGALWSQALIEKQRKDSVPPNLASLVVAIDPATTNTANSDETGIIVAGVTSDREFYVLADASIKDSPDGWVRRAIAEYDAWSADVVLVEANQGGDAWLSMISNVDRTVNARKVHASISKRLRAEPVAALYEQGRVHHVGMFDQLEDQMCTWDPFDRQSKSPDRIDALVWAIGELDRASRVAEAVVPFGATRPSPWKIN